MKTLRYAKFSDKQQFRNLWEISFSDGKAFDDWFFGTRFVPEYCSLIEEEDGFISSEVQSMPLFLKVRNSVIPSAIMVGACTHPNFKKRGYMKELYTYYMNTIGELGVVLCPHTPAVLKTYYYVGHYPVSDTTFITTDGTNGCDINKEIKYIDIKNDNLGGIYKCYCKMIKNYSGIVYRTYADFILKCADYSSCNAKCAYISKNNDVLAYAIYFDNDGIYGEEIVSLDERAEQEIVNFLFNEGKGKKVTVKLPPNSKSIYNNAAKTVSPRNVCGIANVSALLNILGNGLDYIIEIKDDIVKNNNGVFSFSGKRTNRTPQISMPIYSLAQWLFGYRSISEIDNISIFDQKAAKELDNIFVKQNCHIIDEY